MSLRIRICLILITTISFVGLGQGVKTLVHTVSPTSISTGVIIDSAGSMEEPKTYHMNEVQVFGSTFSDQSKEPFLRKLSYSQFRNTAGALDDIARQVMVLPGVAQTSPERNDIVVRGGSPYENLFVVDGIEVGNINHFATQGAGGGSASFINSELIKEISFSTGGFGPEYGDRLSSVLNIRLDDGPTEHPVVKAVLSATQYGLMAEGGIGETMKYVVSARKSYLDLVFRAYGFGYAPNYSDMLIKTTWALGKNDRISVLAVGASDRFDIIANTPAQRLTLAYNLMSDQNHGIVGFSWQHFTSTGFTTAILQTVYGDYQNVIYGDNLCTLFRNSTVERLHTLRITQSQELSKHWSVEGGFSGAFGLTTAGTFVGGIDDGYGNNTFSLSEVQGSLAERTMSSFLSLAWNIDCITASAGLRGEWRTKGLSTTTWSPRMSCAWRLDEIHVLSLNVGRYYQSVPAIWMINEPSNASLAPYGADQIALSFQRALREDAVLKLEIYQKTYFAYPASLLRPYLVMANTGDAMGSMAMMVSSFGREAMVNAGTGRARGIELSFEKKRGADAWYGSYAMSYSESRFTAMDGIEHAGNYDQPLIFNLSGGVFLGDTWEIGVKARYFSGRPYTPASASSVYRLDPTKFNTARLDANHSLDVRVTKGWRIGTVSLQTYLDITNIYNHRTNSLPQFDGGTNTWQQQPAIGIVPSLGIVLEL